MNDANDLSLNDSGGYAAIEQHLQKRSVTSKHPLYKPDFSTLRFLSVRRHLTYEFHVIEFFDLKRNDVLHMTLLLKRAAISDVWRVTSSGGSVGSFDSRIGHDAPSFTTLVAFPQSTPFILAGMVVDKGLDLTRVCLHTSGGDIEDFLQDNLVLFVKNIDVLSSNQERGFNHYDMTVDLINSEGKIVTTQPLHLPNVVNRQ